MANLSNKEGAYTPGPWKILDFSDIITTTRTKSFHVATVEAMTSEFGGEAIANAQLIAAAPELLAALKGLYTQIERVGYTREEDSFMEAAEAAINKAEGRS